MENQNKETLLVSEAMNVQPWTLVQDTRVDEALSQLLQKQLESCVVIERNGRARACLDGQDLGRAVAEGKKRKTLADLLPKEDTRVAADADLLTTIAMMTSRGLRQVPVMNGSQLVGELRLSSIGGQLPALLERKERELRDLRADRERTDEYLGLVSHDMRAPLTVIALSTDYLLAEDSSRSLSPDQKSFVERIKRNGEQASSMIHDILDVVRLQHGFRLDYHVVRFAELVNESIQNLEVLAAKKKLSFQITHDQDIQVKLDPNRMRQVIENVVINAIKFSPQGGQVFIRSWLVQKEGEAHLAFQVRDQGQGIRREDEAKVFEAFVQSGRTRLGKEGVGLGLAIVRKFVEFHQGSIELDGGWQKGASLTIYIPNASLVTPFPKPEIEPRGPVVLLVEDDESIREFYKQSLEEYKFHVIEAADGAEGFALFQKHPVDVVLSDIRMPNVDGLELLARIRTSGSDVPVILCSGYYVGLENDLTRSDHKPNRIIDKPFKVKDMVQAIEDQLRYYKQVS